MSEKILAAFIALVLVAGKMALEFQMRKDSERGLTIDSKDYRYGRIMVRHCGEILMKITNCQQIEKYNKSGKSQEKIGPKSKVDAEHAVRNM